MFDVCDEGPLPWGFRVQARPTWRLCADHLPSFVNMDVWDYYPPLILIEKWEEASKRQWSRELMGWYRAHVHSKWGEPWEEVDPLEYVSDFWEGINNIYGRRGCYPESEQFPGTPCWRLT